MVPIKIFFFSRYSCDHLYKHVCLYTLAVLTAAPNPVHTPQARRQTVWSGAAGSILATAIWLTTVYWENVLVPVNCSTFLPLQVNLDSLGDIVS